MPKFRHLAFALAVVPMLVAACGSESSTFDDGQNGGGGDGIGGGIGGNGGDGDGDGAGGGGEACAAESAAADRKPAHLFFILDQSLSMVSPDPQRWPRVTTAFKTFLDDPRSKGVSAALEMFPVKSSDDACKTSSYTTLDVGLEALPGSAPFQSFLDPTPNTAKTPTVSVLRGIGPIAKAHAEKNPDAKVAIVLMADGIPQGCTPAETTALAVAEVSKIKDVVPTYVIGVGPNLDALNAIADAGGTGSAFLINDQSSPETAQAKFREAIDTIRGRTLSCDLAIPAPPAGQNLDFDKVNVSYTPSNATKRPLDYDEACAAGGWRYDNAGTPTKIVLCPSICDTVKADPNGAIAVEFGCTRRAVVR